MKKVAVLFLALFHLSAQANDASVQVDVNFTPTVGSFQITSSEIKASGVKTTPTYSAEKIEVPIKSLRTGIGLRDEHLHKKLAGAKNAEALIATQIKAEKGRGTAQLEINGIKKEITFSYKDLSKGLAEATFPLDLKDYKIDGVSYMGVGVEDSVTITVRIAYAAP